VGPHDVGEREPGIVDLLLILAAVCLALVTWSSLSDVSGVPPWRAWVGVGITVLLALGATTRNPRWAASIRFIIGGWLIIAPFLLKLENIATAFWSYVMLGVLLAMMATPSLTGLYARARRDGSVARSVYPYHHCEAAVSQADVGDFRTEVS
jgi:hypothetical protein